MKFEIFIPEKNEFEYFEADYYTLECCDDLSVGLVLNIHVYLHGYYTHSYIIKVKSIDGLVINSFK